MPAILQRPQPLPAERPHPPEQLLVAAAARIHRPLATQLASRLLNDSGGVTLLVRINPDYDHSWSPFP